MDDSLASPLAGVRVADFSWFGAGPIAGQVLSNFGAEVIRVESEAHPDGLRSTQPVAPGKEGFNVSGYYNNFNASKLSFTLNMGNADARAVALELLSTCDVVLENYTPRVMEKWGLTYAEVAAVRPDIIYVNVPMQGSWGPHRDFLGFGGVLAPLTGYSYLTGWPDRTPVGSGTNYPDYVINPGHTVIAIMAALRHRDRTGEGQQVEVAQLESTVSGLGQYLLEYAVNGTVAERAGNRCEFAAPHGAFPCAGDDSWCVIAVFSDAQWDALKATMGDPEWAGAERFSTLLGRKGNEDELEQRLAGWARGFAATDLVDRLQGAGVPAGIVQTAEDVLDNDPHLKARGFYAHLDHPDAGVTAYDGPHFRLHTTPGILRSPAPLLGQHNDHVLSELLGIDGERAAELLINQVVF
jgi:crotonobetainyl-CoA:carnitine CoA-transferase CaiB-like acyl-CoA transferase